MSKERVYELAKVLNITSKELISLLFKEFNITVKNHMSVLETEEADLIKQLLKEREDAKKAEVGDKDKIENKYGELEEKKIEEEFKLTSGKKAKKQTNEEIQKEVTNISNQEEVVVIPEIIINEDTITVKELSEKLGKPYTEVIRELIFMGVMANVNQEIDFNTAQKVSEKLEFKLIRKIDDVDDQEKVEEDVYEEEDDEEEYIDTVKRPAVVTVMGHVDHGKTSLLDAIRKSNVIETEAGGITQHIGAYTVKVNNEAITFLDTPGHAAFTAMRARGAQITDIVILVVAADDGIMPQTKEAINHCKAANVPIIVAINKIDRPGANIEKVKQELTEYGLVAEDWGGETICVPVSAKTKEGIDSLLEMVLLTSEMLELKADPIKNAKGTVVEAKLDKGRGPVATLLVQNGTLNVGDSIIVGTTYGRIRAMFDDKGKALKNAGPSIPVEILGLSDVPAAGDKFHQVKDEKTARDAADKRKEKARDEYLHSMHKVSLEDLYSQIKEGKVKELNLIIKADVQGSVEAIKQSLEKLSADEVKVRVIHAAVGAVTETDVTLAAASNAIIIGFNVRPDINASNLAEKENVDIKSYRVIYDAIDDIRSAMIGMLEPEYKEVIQGRVEIRKIYKVSSVGTIAGCYVLTGKVTRSSRVRLIRDGIIIVESELGSLKRFKDDVKEAMAGFECGLSIEKFNDLKEGDILEAFIMQEIKKDKL